MTACVFCQIVEGAEPAETVFEDKLTLAFLDIFPASNGHTLVIPKVHVEAVYELVQPHADAVWHTTLALARAIRSALHPEGLALRQANGAVAGQHVPHLHVHLIPRGASTGPAERDRLPEVAARIREAL